MFFKQKSEPFRLTNLLKFREKKEYIEWDKYKAKIDFLDDFWWQQKIRKRNITPWIYKL